MDNRYNVWNKWDKLKTVVLGDTYKPEFYKDIKDKTVKDILLKICDETLEDLDYFEKVLKDFGCKVLRPPMDPNDNLMNYVDPEGRISMTSGGVPKPPLFPRDHQFVLGSKLVHTGSNEEYPKKVFEAYNNIDMVNLKGYGLNGPCCTVVGKDIYIDLHSLVGFHSLSRKIKDNVFNATGENIRLNYLNIGGHNDACFGLLKPGAILSLFDIQNYKSTFPGWDVCYLPNQSWTQVAPFTKMKQKVKGKWWVPGQENNDIFITFVEDWLENWLGYVEETVFDVNVLVLDEHHVCVTNPNNEKVNSFLKKHNMEPVYIPWRHRFFFDGGLHCLTLDLEREGNMVDYFPERGDRKIIDHRVKNHQR